METVIWDGNGRKGSSEVGEGGAQLGWSGGMLSEGRNGMVMQTYEVQSFRIHMADNEVNCRDQFIYYTS